MKRIHLSRRAFLGGAGATLALPLLEAMTPFGRSAFAQDARPTRLLAYYIPNGIHMQTWTPAAEAMRARLAFVHGALGEPWPDVSDEALLVEPATWLDLTTDSPDLASGLRALVPWPEAGRLDELAPPRLEVPSGSTHTVDYADASGQPVLRVKLQECFGWGETPRLAGVPVLLHLLGPLPGGRPVQVEMVVPPQGGKGEDG